MDYEFSRSTQALYKGAKVRGMEMKPETIPCFMTTAFTMNSLSEVKDVYATKNYTYVRTRNPNRTALGEVISCLEHGEETLIFSSGMGAITTTLISLLNPGDHVICNESIYGETYSVMTVIMKKCGVEVTFVDCNNQEALTQAFQPNTKLVYSEVLSNPTIKLVDLRMVAEIAHMHRTYLMVDNTFTSPIAIRPIEIGADIVINSLTKFLNGHSDAIGGSITASTEIINLIQPISMLCGTPGDPFSAWLIQRGTATASVRIPKQMKTAAKIAATLEKHKHVEKVNHPSLESYPQKELANQMFGENGYCAMLSFIVPEDMEKIDLFMRALRLARYAPTLGGIRTTLSHPVTSSHFNVPDETRRKMGITPGMLRISTGIEEAEDLIADFDQALKVFD